MDYMSSPPGSGASTPLQQMSHNQQRDTNSLFSSFRRNAQLEDPRDRDSSVHDKINQFNSLAMQSKQLERKTADAALKRAMLGREEAETEMRRYRDEARQLRKLVEEGKERERKVGERLETVMENYGRTKETHAHTQALWEKEIRRARKETFKAQSALVKLQEELKSSRAAQKLAEEELEREKERSKDHEQAAFQARYTLVGLQELLDQAMERVKMLEQERDAFKMIAKNEEDVARIAAEGKIPLPAEINDEENDELAASNKRKRASSFDMANIQPSAAIEAEIEELTRLWQWERQRADRAVEHVQFLETECQMKFCPGSKAARASRKSFGSSVSLHRKQASLFSIADAGDLLILSEKAALVSPNPRLPSPKRSKTDILREQVKEQETRRSTVFVPAEGIFRTVSQAEAETLNDAVQQQPLTPAEPVFVMATAVAASSTSTSAPSEPPTPADAMPPVFARTPSVDPPDFAIPAQLPRTSLLSLLDAPHQQEPPLKGFFVPTTPGPLPPMQQRTSETPSAESESDADTTMYHSAVHHTQEVTVEADEQKTITQGPLTEPLPPTESAMAEPPVVRPHTSAAHYAVSVKTTTTRVPLRDETNEPSLASKLMKLQRTPSRAGDRDEPSFDVNNPALTPTMTREQALAQIRERRGRARSVGKGPVVRPSSSASVVTPRRAVPDKDRQVSAPTGRVGILGVTPGTRRVRS
ncbi:hypothetical protein QBC34DRAFT_308893 [Podospora aff. communis PSN243]|uniref:Uncharacterized protein n=1 Tax=Podospora aff. communis PSN243 TaxID=3040156 RepID=A0AAV9GAW4_9PEZI|nr:hypothetical protein QBC34DRAFT_308893 [Podospora aff. communis PSN243]